jgi:hypothetical protein
MTDDQKKNGIMLGGFLAGILTLLFPVCNTSSKMVDEVDFLAVHSYLFAWPSPTVDYGRTLLQLGIVALLTFGAMHSLRLWKSFGPARERPETAPVADAV